MKKTALSLLLILAIASCRKIDDPSTIDTKIDNLEDGMDATIRPGDNFFMYCNGGWWKRTSVGDNELVGFATDINYIMSQKYDNMPHPAEDKLMREVENIDLTTDAAINFIRKQLKLVENISTTDQAHDAIVELMMQGCDNLIVFNHNAAGGKMCAVVSASDKQNVNFDWITHSLTALGLSDAQQITESAKRLLSSSQFANFKPQDLSIKNIEQHPYLYDDIAPLVQTRGVGFSLLDKAIAAMGINPNSVKIYKKSIEFFSKLDTADPYEVKCLLQCYIVNNYMYTSNKAYTEYKSFNPGAHALINAVAIKEYEKMSYMAAYEFSTKYVLPERKAEMVSYCEELRAAFHKRIARLDWMSETTKQKAQEKLKAMIFNVGYPDQWVEAALPSLRGASLLEYMSEISKCDKALFTWCAGKPVSEAGFNAILSRADITEMNASYAPTLNSLTILPVWMLDPLYDETVSEAYIYAMSLFVVGHEITHGFSIVGAGYNKLGDRENWWTVSDQMEYIARQQKLIDCYNMLDVLPDELPGVYGDGTKTLDENIADLGGLAISLDAYTAKLKAEGYKDKELIKQQKKFFQAYAHFYRGKYNAAYVSWLMQSDGHSLSKERVNGVVMNLDRWYDIYDVKWGDKLYLKPQNRTHIW